MASTTQPRMFANSLRALMAWINNDRLVGTLSTEELRDTVRVRLLELVRDFVAYPHCEGFALMPFDSVELQHQLQAPTPRAHGSTVGKRRRTQKRPEPTEECPDATTAPAADPPPNRSRGACEGVVLNSAEIQALMAEDEIAIDQSV